MGRTMAQILAFCQDVTSRSKYKKYLYKIQDASNLTTLETQLTHSFQIFEVRILFVSEIEYPNNDPPQIQSSVHLRMFQQEIVDRLRELPPVTVSHINRCVHYDSMNLRERSQPNPIPSPMPIANRILSIPEGLYLIRCALNGRVLEAANAQPTPKLLPAYAAPRSDKISMYQLWIIFHRDGRMKYTIRNFATGVVLDIDCETNRAFCWPCHGRENQVFEFIGSTRSAS